VGGLITEASHRAAILGAGARAITTSSGPLWR
jgi:glycerol-3-phosphate responsive antiterminator